MITEQPPEASSTEFRPYFKNFLTDILHRKIFDEVAERIGNTSMEINSWHRVPTDASGTVIYVGYSTRDHTAYICRAMTTSPTDPVTLSIIDPANGCTHRDQQRTDLQITEENELKQI